MTYRHITGIFAVFGLVSMPALQVSAQVLSPPLADLSKPATSPESEATVSGTPPGFAPGDVFVSLETGSVQWRKPDGTLSAELVGRVPGRAEGLAFDSRGNLYVSHWCADARCRTGNTVEKFDRYGVSQGAVGGGYSCNPHALAFDAAGSLYVGHADCTGAILKLSPARRSTWYRVQPDNRGAFWIDLAGDGCTIFYTSWGPNVKRFDVCANRQLGDFNVAPLPGGEAHGLRVLPDGGVLVSSGAVIARLDSTGALIQTYRLWRMNESQYWAGLDLVGDGTFWAINYLSSNVIRFDLATGEALDGFNTGTAVQTAVDVAVCPGVPL
jgi:outer membrane protein assembly factor BamB